MTKPEPDNSLRPKENLCPMADAECKKAHCPHAALHWKRESCFIYCETKKHEQHCEKVK